MHPFECRVSKNSKEIRKPSLVINAKKWKTIEWERLEISSRKLAINTKGTLGTIKDRNGMDLTEAEDIKKRWRDYTDDLLDHQKSQRVPEKHLLLLY